MKFIKFCSLVITLVTNSALQAEQPSKPQEILVRNRIFNEKEPFGTKKILDLSTV